MSDEIKVGGFYIHAGKYVSHGKCIVLAKNRLGFKIQVWGGIEGDKLYTFSGIKAEELVRGGK